MSSAFIRLLVVLTALCGGASLRAAIMAERSIGSARILEVAATPTADLVVLDAGFATGLRQGMVCTVRRDGASLGELLLVDLRSAVSTALILELAPGQALRAGDDVAVKTISSTK